MAYTWKEGNYEKLGVQLENEEVIFTFEGEKEDHCALLLYHKDGSLSERIEVPQEFCHGAIRSICVRGIDVHQLIYHYEKNGVLETDPYATRIIGREKWNDINRIEKQFSIYSGFDTTQFDWQEDKNPEVPRQQMVMYKIHVRGFSMNTTSHNPKQGTFRAVLEKIPYLKKLGVTTIEFMPIYEFEEMTIDNPVQWPEYLKHMLTQPIRVHTNKAVKNQKVNYWGYVPGNYFAVKSSYSSNLYPSLELKELIRELHKNDMEFIMEMYFAKNANPNTILDALRFWVKEYHVDGFHLLGETIPVHAVASDLLLRRTKLFFDGFCFEVPEQKSNFQHLFSYNDAYLYAARKMLNHLNGNMEEFLTLQHKQGLLHGSVNYIAGTNGFTLFDIFSYQEKHNETNGEENRDGTNWNYSSNYGIEGSSSKKIIRDIRELQLRNAIAILFLGQGVPLLLAGDEFGNSQNGNNNAYCQDNEIGWINWKEASKYAWFTNFVATMIKFRKEHPVISTDEPKRFCDYNRKGLPDLSYHSENAWLTSVTHDRLSVGEMHCGSYGLKSDGTEDDFVYVGYNFGCNSTELALPVLPQKKHWYLVMDTSRGREPFFDTEQIINDRKIKLEKQSLVLLVGK